MMRHLRFLKRHDKAVRQQIYKVADFVEIPAQTVLFEIGDVADYMYIILKGRVVISDIHFYYKDISRILSTLRDGEEFGAMHIVENDHEPDDALNHNLRMMSAKTVERSRVLRVSIAEASAIMRPSGGQDASTIYEGVSQVDKQSKVSRKSSTMQH